MSAPLRWPKVMPAWAYRDPATIGENRTMSDGVSVPHETVQAPAPRRDGYYTQARRVLIRNLMRGR